MKLDEYSQIKQAEYTINRFVQKERKAVLLFLRNIGAEHTQYVLTRVFDIANFHTFNK